MAGIRIGPNQEYADEYARVNMHIDRISAALAAEIQYQRVSVQTACSLGSNRRKRNGISGFTRGTTAESARQSAPMGLSCWKRTLIIKKIEICNHHAFNKPLAMKAALSPHRTAGASGVDRGLPR